MLRRWTGIALIFTANILLLAYSVAPHHHHNGIPHFAWFDSDHSEDSHQCNSCCCHHENGETCLFEQGIDVVYETKEDCSHALCALHNHDSEMLLQAVLWSYNYDFSSVLKELPPKEPPYLINYCSDYANTGLGLRAPPAV
ncbi:hypothetical protein FACS189426_13330 [Bacteroidia bacterium]|nr:hypothetical protein FACS189426_13330 [Bacteroidia bacterium]